MKYLLNDNEIKQLDAVWKFIGIFSKPYIFVSKYREHLMKQVRRRYTAEQFYEYEKIVNKLFWNLRWAVFPLFLNGNDKELPKSLLCCETVEYDGVEDLENKLRGIYEHLDVYYRSFINKLIIIDSVNNKIHYKKMDGSSGIFAKNLFNTYCMTVLFDRELYERVMRDPTSKVDLPEYYYQGDYGFPNVNCCVYEFGDDILRINRVKKMYYNYSNDF